MWFAAVDNVAVIAVALGQWAALPWRVCPSRHLRVPRHLRPFAARGVGGGVFSDTLLKEQLRRAGPGTPSQGPRGTLSLCPPMHMQEVDAPLPPTWVAVHYLLLMRTLHLSFTGQIRSLLLFPFALRGHLNPGSLLRLNVPRLGEERARSSRACFSLNRRSLQGN